MAGTVYVSREQIHEAKKLDLLTYLQQYEPHELVRLSPNVYSTISHDSLKISNGKWCWWSQGIGGKSALDYLIKVRGMGFQEAVLYLSGCLRCAPELSPPIRAAPVKSTEPRSFVLPQQNHNHNRVLSYLTGRGIAPELLNACIQSGQLYEDTRHNCVFVGFDPAGQARYAFLRSSSPGSTFLMDVEGSDKRYSFSIEATAKTDTVCLFESAIDLLSFIMLEEMAGRDWQGAGYLSLSGVYEPGREKTGLPLALEGYLSRNPEVRRVVLCLDHDGAGHTAAEAIRNRLPTQHTADFCFPRLKDYNAQLCHSKGITLPFKTRGMEIVR